jgi:ABC-2 type transport system permease protein
MSKLGLIVKREYWTRVKKPSFLLATFLTPLAFGLIIFLSAYFTSQMGNQSQKVLVVDDNNILPEYPLESKTMTFDYRQTGIEEAKKSYVDDGFDLIIHVEPIADFMTQNFDVSYYSKEKLGFAGIEKIEDYLSASLKKYKLDQTSIDKVEYNQLNTSVNLENALANSDESGVEGDTSSSTAIAIGSVLSYAMGFMMYMVIFIFGGLVMRSVMEEKLNRIVEVIVSTVKPMQLMLGKLIGVGGVGLTQLLIWIILIPIIGVVVMQFFGGDASAMAEANAAQSEEMMKAMSESEGMDITKIIQEAATLNWALIIPVFIIFFLGGYFIYASLFAAVGSAIGEDMGEAQQFMMPISIPVIASFIMIPAVIDGGDSFFVKFVSIFPLTSPILMPARLPSGPPIWEVILSIVVLIASVFFFVWMAGRIYRVGIFMHGKKISFKELAKWVRYNY